MIMITLSRNDLTEFVSALESDFPASLNIYYMAKRQAENRHAWPGVTFVVDSFPDFSACICRTDPDSPNVPPFVDGYTIFIHARNPEKLKWLLDQPGAVDWTKRIGVHNVEWPGCMEALKEKCRRLGGEMKYSMDSDFYVERANYTGFRIKDIHCQYTLPEGFRIGPLEEHHADQLTREKHYGDLDKNFLFFQYVLRHRFPTAAIFNEKNEAIAYIMQRPEGCIGVGYVNPAYRQRGYFKIVLYELLKEMERQGETQGYADFMADNKASLGAMLSIGGFVYPDYEACWFDYVPRASAQTDEKTT